MSNKNASLAWNREWKFPGEIILYPWGLDVIWSFTAFIQKVLVWNTRGKYATQSLTRNTVNNPRGQGGPSPVLLSLQCCTKWPNRKTCNPWDLGGSRKKKCCVGKTLTNLKYTKNQTWLKIVIGQISTYQYKNKWN